jgi:tetratricopeptide (TPR) repeat protein
LAHQGDIAMYQGRFRAAHAFYSAIAGFWPPTYEADYAVWDVETGNATRARESAQKALAANPEGPMKPLLVLVLARAADVHQARELADSIGRKSPASTLVQNYQLPTIRAAMELNAGRAKEAIEILKVSAPYELADPAALSDPFGGLYPCYIRGLAYVKLGEGKRAAAEFQKLVGHPGLGLGIPTGPLSYLQLSRAQAMMGDTAAARKSYQDFLTLWKDADPDIPIYKEAKAEYAKLL